MKIRAIAALLFILISVSAFGEGRIKITGYVRDADGNPLELVHMSWRPRFEASRLCYTIRA